MAEDRVVIEPASDAAPVLGTAPERAPESTSERTPANPPAKPPARTAEKPPEKTPTLTGRGVRARLARIGTSRQVGNPVLEPLFRTVRANHPKADLALIERAYDIAEKYHRGQMRKSGDPYITHPLAVTTILADIGMTEPTLVAALL
ncbi:MAG: pyrophosphokinae, partial [Marmoricola sp.]|nr:pyrophosphokinae [Marmoricola sp.]